MKNDLPNSHAYSELSTVSKTPNQSPAVSVIMPVYKVERYVGESIHSVLNQKFQDFELIILDDASPDASTSEIMKFTDPRIRCLHHETNQGLAMARNTAIRAASGNYIALLDSDDIALPNRLMEQIRFLDANPNVGVVGTWAELIDEAGDDCGSRYNPYPDRLLRPLMVFRNTLIVSSLMIRREALPDELFQPMLAEDYDFTSRISQIWDIAVLPQPLIQYRLNSQGLMSTRWQQVKDDTWRTQQRLLEQLGIYPSPEEKTLHQRISHATSDGMDSLTAQRASHWMRRILESNRQRGCYPQSDLEEAASEVLTSLWRQTTGEGVRVVPKAFSSFSVLGVRPKMSQMARLAAKAFMASR